MNSFPSISFSAASEVEAARHLDVDEAKAESLAPRPMPVMTKCP